VPPGAVGSAEGGLVDLSVQAAASKTAAAAAAKSVRRPIRRPAEERDPSGSCRGAEGMSAILTKHAVSTPVKCSPATSRWIFDRDTAWFPGRWRCSPPRSQTNPSKHRGGEHEGRSICAVTLPEPRPVGSSFPAGPERPRIRRSFHLRRGNSQRKAGREPYPTRLPDRAGWRDRRYGFP
jgi:hypothetical protein